MKKIPGSGIKADLGRDHSSTYALGDSEKVTLLSLRFLIYHAVVPPTSFWCPAGENSRPATRQAWDRNKQKESKGL